MLRVAKLLLLTLLSFCSAYSQGKLVADEFAFSTDVHFGRYATDNRFGFGCGLVLKGVVELSFARSTVLTKGPVLNFEHRFFLRIFAPKPKRYFISVGGGYVSQSSSTELWKDFPLELTAKGIAFEVGLHVVLEELATRRIVASFAYTYFRPRVEMRVPMRLFTESKLSRSVAFDINAVYHLGHFDLAFGPGFALESDFRNAFVGLRCNVVVKV
ncbi:MAG: hypothetical protein HY961_03785 [Ignavibacteriae bacterium]|nr:hypothetical protein [Ignavibacteriota bacterium]